MVKAYGNQSGIGVNDWLGIRRDFIDPAGWFCPPVLSQSGRAHQNKDSYRHATVTSAKEPARSLVWVLGLSSAAE